MIYVFEQGNIVYDGSTISEAQKAQAIAVESLPIPETPAGKYAVLKADKANERVWYEYVDLPQAPLEQRINLVENALNELLLGGM
jgi:hypothetical protein